MQIQTLVEEHLIIQSWFVVLLVEDICYINLVHAQNMPR